MFSDVFSGLLDQRNVTVYRLCKDLDWDQSMVGRWSRGERLPSAENLIKLADYFDVSIDYLVGRDNIPNRKEKDK